ncbi:MAG TPA: ankyrin repeat domain-containing protein [Chthoniobacteraceae bacterium]|nr:ankyrin repeat domain-containing protein [Chthoniobacteraceae bacterium]
MENKPEAELASVKHSRVSVGANISLVLCAVGIAVAILANLPIYDNGLDELAGQMIGLFAAGVLCVAALIVAMVTWWIRAERRLPARMAWGAALVSLAALVGIYILCIWWPTPSRFVRAAAFGNLSMMHRAIVLGLPLDAPAPHLMGFGGMDRGQTPLTAAAQNGQLAAAQLLINHGASVAVPDGYGDLPLVLAANSGNRALVSLLLSRGADVNASDSDGATALYEASRNRDAAMARLLLAAGANPNVAGGGNVNHPLP